METGIDIVFSCFILLEFVFVSFLTWLQWRHIECIPVKELTILLILNHYVTVSAYVSFAILSVLQFCPLVGIYFNQSLATIATETSYFFLVLTCIISAGLPLVKILLKVSFHRVHNWDPITLARRILLVGLGLGAAPTVAITAYILYNGKVVHNMMPHFTGTNAKVEGINISLIVIAVHVTVDLVLFAAEKWISRIHLPRVTNRSILEAERRQETKTQAADTFQIKHIIYGFLVLTPGLVALFLFNFLQGGKHGAEAKYDFQAIKGFGYVTVFTIVIVYLNMSHRFLSFLMLRYRQFLTRMKPLSNKRNKVYPGIMA